MYPGVSKIKIKEHDFEKDNKRPEIHVTTHVS